MGGILLLLSVGLGLATLVGQVVGWQRSTGSWRQSVVRLLVFVGWGALLLFALFAFVMFHYCEHNCSSALNPRALPIFAGIVVLNLGVLWLALRGISRIP
jgi:dolichol kinase